MKGSLVMALAGRDKDRLFFVTDDIDENFVEIADGRSRRLEKPKVKKIKHIKLISDETELGSDIREGRPVTNQKLRRAISEWQAIHQ